MWKSDELKSLLINERNIIDINARFPQLQNKTILMIACQSGNIGCVQVILDNGGDINREGIYYGDSTLTSACLSGNLELLHYLIDKGLLLNDTLIFECFHALYNAKRLECKDNVEIIKVLLSDVQDINYTHNNESLLHLICKAGQPNITLILLDLGVDPNAVNKDGRDALYIAANEGHVEVVKVLLDCGVDMPIPADRLDAAFRAACLHGRLDVVAFLIERGAAVYDSNSEFPLASPNSLMQQASFRGHTGLVRLLLEHGADRNALNSNHHDALYVAAREGQVEVVKALLEWGVGKPIPVARIGIAYVAACRSSSTEVAEYIIGNRLTVDYTDVHGHCPLSHAVSCGRLALVTHIISKGANVNATDPDGDSMLLLACKRTNLAAMRQLLEHGADPNAVGRAGNRPIYQTAFANISLDSVDHLSSLTGPNKETGQLLLDYGADINLPFIDGCTVLTCAVLILTQQRRVSLDLITWLLDKGADISFIDARSGQTALMIAVTYGLIDLVKLLLERGADINQANGISGNTPLMIAAVITYQVDIVRLLLERGADVGQLSGAGQGVLDMFDGSWKYRRIIRLCHEYLETNRPHSGLTLK